MPQGEELLPGAVARDPEIDRLDPPTGHGRTAREFAFHYTPEGLLHRHVECLGVRISEHRDAEGVGRLLVGVFPIVSLPIAVGGDVALTFLAPTTMSAGAVSAAHVEVDAVERRVPDVCDPQTELEDSDSDESSGKCEAEVLQGGVQVGLGELQLYSASPRS